MKTIWLVAGILAFSVFLIARTVQAQTSVPSLTPQEVSALVAQGKALLVDVR